MISVQIQLLPVLSILRNQTFVQSNSKIFPCLLKMIMVNAESAEATRK